MLNNNKIKIAIIVLMIFLTVIIVISFFLPRIFQSTKNPIPITGNSTIDKTKQSASNNPIVDNKEQANQLNNNNNKDNKNSIKQTGQKTIISPSKTIQQDINQLANNDNIPNLSNNYVPRYRPITITPTKTYDTKSPTFLPDLFALLFNFSAPAKTIDELSVSQNLSQDYFIQPSNTPTPQKNYLQKTGIYLMSEYSSGAISIINAKPQIIKVMDPQYNALLNATKDYKKIFPKGIVILRLYESTRNLKYTINEDPVTSAQNFHQKVIAPGLASLGENKQLFDYLEAPNENDSTPGWESLENIAWLTKFWEELVRLNSQNGIKTCIGSIPVGNPPGGYNEIKEKIQAFLPALIKTQQNGGAVCYHAYSLEYTQDTNKEILSSLRYRLIHQAITEIEPSLTSLPFILSEAGIDQNGNPQESGWQARGGVQQYINWIEWFDKQISQDNYVIGATLYQIGDNYWSSFNLEPIATWIAGKTSSK